MKLVLGISLVLLVVIPNSTQYDLQWHTTQASAMDGWSHSAELATSAAAWSATAVSSTETLQTAAPEASLRLLDAMEEKATNYYSGQAHGATSGDHGACTAIGTAQVEGRYTGSQAPHYDDEPSVVSCGDGPHPASLNAQCVSSTATMWRGDASLGETTAAPGSTASVSAREESGGSAAPEPGDWVSWLPARCQHWPRDGPLGVPRDEQLKAFTEALVQHSVEIRSFLIQTAELTGTDEPSPEEPETHFVTVVVHKMKLLPEFYKWIFEQLNMTEPDSDHIPKSLYEFLEALKHHTDTVKSICDLSPSMDLTCSAPDPGSQRDFFWAMDQQLIWMHVLHHWAANQYNLTAVPQTNISWWLPHGSNEGTLVNVSFFPTLNLTGESILGLEEFSSASATGERDAVPGNANSEDEPSENYWSNRELDQEEPNGEGKLTSGASLCVLSTGHEAEQLTETDCIPLGDGEPESSEEGGHPLEDDGVDVNPDESTEDPLVAEELERKSVEVNEEEEQDSTKQQMVPDPGNGCVCSETFVEQELGLGFDPSSLQYARCDELDPACAPPARCTPVSSVATLAMAPWGRLPQFPHEYLGRRQRPDGSFTVWLSVPSSCACFEPLYGI